MMKKHKGNIAVGLVAIMALAMVGAVSYSSQKAKDAQHITKASKTAGSEEARSLEVLDNATHAWLDDEYNRARTWEYDTRYEIPISELMERNLLPTDFAKRYLAVGESVYGLPYTTSVIKRVGTSGDDEFNVLTTIGTRGTPPPEHPPSVCVTVFDYVRNGISQIGGAVGLETSDGSMPWQGSCRTAPSFLPVGVETWNSLPNWLISNWGLVDPQPIPFPPHAANFSCNVNSNNASPGWQIAADFADPLPIDDYMRCTWSDNTVVNPGSCPARFSWFDVNGNPHHILGVYTWSNLVMKSYSGACSESIRSAAYSDIMNDNGLNRSTAGLPFAAGNYACTNNTSYINCVLSDASTPPGGSDYCDVYVYNDVTDSYDFDETYTGVNCYGLVP